MNVPTCQLCGLPGHQAKTCNRPEGVAHRNGRVLTMDDIPPTWKNASPLGLSKAASAGGKAKASLWKLRQIAKDRLGSHGMPKRDPTTKPGKKKPQRASAGL